mmetsp:Transcript_69726/g.220760  ORF Transcript_69726/g.220760 Transcript_69726/m.220760 type:complete len:265 (-) Transcript_69726:55-849(-)
MLTPTSGPRARPMRKYGPPPLTLPLVAIAESDSDVMKVQVQHMTTMLTACHTPACPTSQLRRMKKMTPRMFWRQGRKTPATVPRSFGAASPLCCVRGDGKAPGPSSRSEVPSSVDRPVRLGEAFLPIENRPAERERASSSPRFLPMMCPSSSSSRRNSSSSLSRSLRMLYWSSITVFSRIASEDPKCWVRGTGGSSLSPGELVLGPGEYSREARRSSWSSIITLVPALVGVIRPSPSASLAGTSTSRRRIPWELTPDIVTRRSH